MATKQSLDFWMGGDSEVAAIVITNKETVIPARVWSEFLDWWEINNADDAMGLIEQLNDAYIFFLEERDEEDEENY